MPARSVTVTDPLLAAIAGDGARFALTRPKALVLWALLAVALVSGLVPVVVDGPAPANLLVPVLAAVLGVVLPILTTRSLRRSLAAALPTGSTLTVDVREEGLRIESARGTAEAAWSTYRDVSALRSAVLLRTTGSPITTMLPRQLVTEEDLALMRRKVG